jgi:hypothetical protein
MQPISVSKILGLGVSTLVAGFGVAEILVGYGSAFPVAPASLALSLAVIGVGVFAASFPIARYRKAREQGSTVKRPNSFTAFRILLFARATTITAAGFLGWFSGQLIWLLTLGNPVEGLVIATSLGVVASALMLILGLLAELNCRAPKDHDGEVKG